MTAVDILNNVDASLDKRKSAAHLLSESSDLMRQTITIAQENNELSLNALMVFEVLGRSDFSKLEPVVSRLIDAANIFKNASSRRCLAKIFNFAINRHMDELSEFELSREEKSEIIKLSFLWLISNEKTAVKVFSMQNIYDLREDENWIKEELKGIIRKDLPNSSAGYKSRGVKILRKLEQ